MSNIASDLYAKDQLYTFSLRRLGFLLVAIIMFVTSEYATSVYRATVYQQQIADWGLADVSGNLLGVIALNYLFLFLVHADWSRGCLWIGGTSLGMIVYEFIQPMFPWGTFDYLDIAATIIGAVVSLVIFSGLQLLPGPEYHHKAQKIAS
ncbi:MAG: hypothetical protein ACOX5R_10030 [bacterium]|jgi:hypothetical protein